MLTGKETILNKIKGGYALFTDFKTYPNTSKILGCFLNMCLEHQNSLEATMCFKLCKTKKISTSLKIYNELGIFKLVQNPK